MRYSRDELIYALKRVYVPFVKNGLTLEEFRDLRDCVEIARACGAFDKKQVTMCEGGDAIADIDAGVDDVFDKE